MTNDDIISAFRSALKQDRQETGDFSGIAEALQGKHNAESDAERWSGRAKRTGNWLKLVVVSGGIAAGVFGWWTSRVEDRVRGQVVEEQKVEAAAHRAEHVDAEINRLDESVGNIDSSLTEHVDEQRIENQATRARTVRTEVMIEQLLRRRGSRPPSMSPKYKALQMSVGVDTDDPLNGL